MDQETCIICQKPIPADSRAADMCDRCVDEVFPPRDPNRSPFLPE